MRKKRYTLQKRAVTTVQGPLPDLVGATIVCTGVDGTVVNGGGDVAVVVGLEIFSDGAGRGVETCSSGLRV